MTELTAPFISKLNQTDTKNNTKLKKETRLCYVWTSKLQTQTTTTHTRTPETIYYYSLSAYTQPQ